MTYPAPFIDWLYSAMKGTGFHYTPLEIIQNEVALPRIWADLGLIDWQERLIRQQIETEKRKKKQ